MVFPWKAADIPQGKSWVAYQLDWQLAVIMGEWYPGCHNAVYFFLQQEVKEVKEWEKESESSRLMQGTTPL